MTTPIEAMAALVVGAVESVSPSEIRVLLDLDAPHATALNNGTPVAFPRINGYVLIPNEAGATVAHIAWIGIERSPYPKRSGLKDFGLIDLPFPLRKMSVIPVGTLTYSKDRQSGLAKYELSRGVRAFPSVGDQVLIPTGEQVEAIVGAKESDRRVRIGSSPMANSATIMVDPDKLFGRHLAVLGNTGSGKSCTVAGLIRWSRDAASREIDANCRTGTPNARFIVLDPNGEYAHAFRDDSTLRVFRVPPVDPSQRSLDVPAWLWSGHEWSAVAQAQPGAQRPLLLQSLRELKSGQSTTVPRDAMIRRHLQSYVTRISSKLNMGPQALGGDTGPRFDCGRLLQLVADDCNHFSQSSDPQFATALHDISVMAGDIIESRRAFNRNFFNDFHVEDFESIRERIVALIETLPDFGSPSPISEDAPIHFDVTALSEHIEKLATDHGGNLTGFISTLGIRIRGMLADARLGAVIAQDPPTSFETWLETYVGADGAANGQIAVIDLSLVPSEVVHIVVSVLGRLVFESLQRYRRSHSGGLPLPTVLVLEEAHNFIRSSRVDDVAMNSAQLCRETFERIAREGRKFGLGLVLSSQRPSELSPTVLAQCNTFLLHRIVNNSDQDLVAKLVPDNVSGLLKELPSLPSRQAILLGWATPIPVLVEIDELPMNQRPLSSDPDFWDVWTLKEPRPINWPAIAAEWSGEQNASFQANSAVDANQDRSEAEIEQAEEATGEMPF